MKTKWLLLNHNNRESLNYFPGRFLSSELEYIFYLPSIRVQSFICSLCFLRVMINSPFVNP